MFFTCKLLFYACNLLFYSRNLWGDILGNFLGDGSIKFFNRSPLTLKFGAEKKRERVKKEKERESQEGERESESESASCCIYVRKFVFVLYS